MALSLLLDKYIYFIAACSERLQANWGPSTKSSLWLCLNEKSSKLDVGDLTTGGFFYLGDGLMPRFPTCDE